MRHRIIDTCTGQFVIIKEGDGRLATSWLTAGLRKKLASSRLDPALMPRLASRLKKYFEGDDVDFSDVPTPAGSPFHVKCWNACRSIPRGTTWSYAALARGAGSTADAARAAGQAMRNNPLPIIVPCHRVIASNGSLHGFAGSCDTSSRELSIKRSLLDLEGIQVEHDDAASSPARRHVFTPGGAAAWQSINDHDTDSLAQPQGLIRS